MFTVPEFHFIQSAGETELVFPGGLTKRFMLQVPDYSGRQTDRLPLPEHFNIEDTARAVLIYDEVYGDPRFPYFSVRVDNPVAPGQATIWAQRLN